MGIAVLQRRCLPSSHYLYSDLNGEPLRLGTTLSLNGEAVAHEDCCVAEEMSSFVALRSSKLNGEAVAHQAY